METEHLVKFHNQYIKNTKKESLVTNKRFLLCRLKRGVAKKLECKEATKVYISTRALKHLYDWKPSEEYDFLIRNVDKFVEYPEAIYESKEKKRGDYCLVKTLQGEKYLCSIEKKNEDGEEAEYEIATSFRIRKANYLAKKYEKIWTWEEEQEEQKKEL